MAYPNRLRERARSLRTQGKTYLEIRQLLDCNIPKSTLSSWCQDVTLPHWYQNKIDELNKKNFTLAQQRAWASLRLKREKFLSELIKENQFLVKKLKDRWVLKLILSILYLGEGSKWRSHSGLILGSSDPTVVRLYLRLLELCYGLSPRQLKCRISYRADQDIKSLERYWSRVTSIPPKNFYKTIPDPRTLGKPTKKLDYKGVCVIMGGSTKIQLELEIIPTLILKGLW